MEAPLAADVAASDTSLPPPPGWSPRALPRPGLQSLIRVAAGVALALLVLAGGRVLERVRLGASDPEAVRRIDADVRATIEARTAELRTITTRVPVTAEAVAAAAADPQRARALFDAAERAIAAAPRGRAALTVFGPAGRPLAWSGRPAELPAERLDDGRELFVAPGPLGPRLVYVTPIVDRSGRRVAGTVAVERTISDTGDSVAGDDATQLPTALVPVSIRVAYEGAGTSPSPWSFVVSAPDGRPLLEARVEPAAVAQLRARFRDRTHDAALAVLALAVLAALVPLAASRERARTLRQYVPTTAALIALVALARILAFAAVPDTWWWPALPDTYNGAWAVVLRSAPDLVLTAGALLALVWLASDAIERRRLALRGVAAPLASTAGASLFFTVQIGAGLLLTVLLLGHRTLLEYVFTRTPVDPARYSLHPFTAERLALVLGVLLLHVAVFWGAVVALRAAATVRRLRRTDYALRLSTATLWLAPLAIVTLAGRLPAYASTPLWVAAVAAVVMANVTRRVAPRLRRGSQALRLVLRFLVIALPGVVFYPTMARLSTDSAERLITTELGPQALSHRSELQVQLQQALRQIDGIPDLLSLIASSSRRPGEPPSTDAAFAVWRQTVLARLRLTSSIELYSGDGTLVSRFALNLPEASATQQWREASCTWEVFGEPLAGTDDQVLLHAGRGLCAPGTGSVPQGAVVVHVMLDYATLPFLASQNAYGELLQPGGEVRSDAHGRTIEFAMYGWGRTAIFPTAGTAWPISRELLDRIYRAGRRSIWEVVHRGDERYRVYFMNDRSGIYALGYVLPDAVDHLIALAELLTFSAAVYVLLLALIGIIASLGGYEPGTGRALLREIRGSYYRKLFLAFVAAAVVPVIALAVLTRAYIASQLRDSIESAAVQTAGVAKRVVDAVASQQRRDTGASAVLGDEAMIWVSRVINQDVNVFAGPRLVASSQRDLFASGELPTRTPAEVYRAIVLERQASYVGEERIGDFAYMVAAAPIREGDVRTILTVPLALRQQEIEREIDALDRRVLLASVCFILLGAAIGYYMAERIADPVNRLTRATRRIARGDLDAHIVTTSADELRRLVDAFNSMAADLRRQRVELERTNRLAAWADMARQVAHDIKNPLTPIQLSAEHLRRVHQDRGQPLGAVLDGCVDTILSQVRLLRQISSEFSSFASAPVARLVSTDLNEVVEEVVQPYLTSPARGVSIRTALAAGLPRLLLDRTLLGRALVNVIENALHAMPAGGTLTVRTRSEGAEIILEAEDTGVGMDAEARGRLFEPYFSTKASGTGLGLTIAKRNVELNHGTIEVESEAGRGTRVTMRFGRA